MLALFERGVDGTRAGYAAIVGRLARASVLGLVAVAATVLGIKWLSDTTPSGFLPSEDQGYLMVDVQLPDAAALNRTEAVTTEMEALLREEPGVTNVVTVNGYSMLTGGAPNAAFMAVTLENWAERQDLALSAHAIQRKLMARFDQIATASIIVFNPPPIPGLGNSAGVEMQVQQVGGGTPQDLVLGAGLARIHGEPAA